MEHFHFDIGLYEVYRANQVLLTIEKISSPVVNFFNYKSASKNGWPYIPNICFTSIKNI